ncbi:hypothetical protein [Flavobacterium sp. XS2P14]|uniref:hypothetical protein n=1 Tax=Flavobacterium sp. XS2P14 TaxID=3401735 RepID=UPI003AB0FC97
MKNIAYSLTITFLFGMFFPSYQAYAKGNNSFATLPKMQFNTKFTDDLVNKLSLSKTFAAYYYQLHTIAVYTSTALSTKSDAQLNQVSSRIEQIIEKKDNNIDNLYSELGLIVDKDFTTKTNDLLVKLKSEFPSLTAMSESQLSDVINKSIIKGDLLNRAVAFDARNNCYDNANSAFAKCIAGRNWYAKLVGAVAVICVAALIVCLAVATFETGGAGAIAFAEALKPGTILCIKYAVAAFTTDAVAVTVECDQDNAVRISNCHAQFGSLTGGGAE